MSSGQYKYSYGHAVTAAASTSGEYSLLTVTAAKKLRIKKLTVHFPNGVGYHLQIALLRGTMQRVPDGGYLTGDNNTISVECDILYESGEDVKVWYNNTDTTNSHSCYVLVEGVIE